MLYYQLSEYYDCDYFNKDVKFYIKVGKTDSWDVVFNAFNLHDSPIVGIIGSH